MLKVSAVKKAMEKRARIEQAKRLLLFIKHAQEQEQPDYVARRRKLKLILSALIGGGYGAGLGINMATATGGSPGAGALIGAGLGGAAGLGLGALSNKVREYSGQDPLLHTVAIGKQ